MLPTPVETAGVPISEHIIFTMLMIARKGRHIIENQIAHKWKGPREYLIYTAKLRDYWVRAI